MNDGLRSETLPDTIFAVLRSFQRTEALKAAVQLDLFTAIS